MKWCSTLDLDYLAVVLDFMLPIVHTMYNTKVVHISFHTLVRTTILHNLKLAKTKVIVTVWKNISILNNSVYILNLKWCCNLFIALNVFTTKYWLLPNLFYGGRSTKLQRGKRSNESTWVWLNHPSIYSREWRRSSRAPLRLVPPRDRSKGGS